MDTKTSPETGKDVSGEALKGTNQSGMRERNERLVLSLVRRSGALSKSEIARMTGLSAQTVSVIMRALEADGLLIRGEPVRGRVGQPSVPMALAPDGALFFGLKIGRRSTDLVLTDFLGRVISRSSTTYSHPTLAATLRFAVDAYNQQVARLSAEQQTRVSGIGIAVPYQLWDWANALQVDRAEMDAWRDADLKRDLAEALGQPVYVENDATAACGAELVFGSEDAPPNFLYFYVGFFIGGGLVINRRLYTGPNGNAAALGSFPVAAADGRIVQLLDEASLSVLERDLHAKGKTATHLWATPEAWAVDDAILHGWIERAAKGIADAIVASASLLDCPAAIIEGWLPAPVKQALVAATEVALAQANLSGLNRPIIMAGQVGPDARSLGAASLPLAQRYLVDGPY